MGIVKKTDLPISNSILLETNNNLEEEEERETYENKSFQKKIVPSIPWEIFEKSEEIFRDNLLHTKERQSIIVVASLVEKSNILFFFSISFL